MTRHRPWDWWSGYALSQGGGPPPNELRNNTMVGGIAPSTLPDNWTINGFAGLTPTYAYGTEDTYNYIDVTLAGTTSDGTGGDIRFEGPTQIVAVNGQHWTNSVYARVSAGALTNISSVKLDVVQRNGAGASVGILAGSAFGAGLTATIARFTQNLTTNQATIAYVQPRFVVAINGTGVAINVTFRIYMPVMQKGDVATVPPQAKPIPFDSGANLLSNSRGLGGTATTPPFTWTRNGWAGLTVGYAYGVEKGEDYTDVRLSGTTSDTLGGSLRFEDSTTVPAALGGNTTFSLYAKIVGGDTTGFNSLTLAVSPRDSLGGALTSISGTSITGLLLSIARKRFFVTGTFADAATVYQQPIFTWGINSAGVTVDLTLRIYHPRLEPTALPSDTPVPTPVSVEPLAGSIPDTAFGTHHQSRGRIYVPGGLNGPLLIPFKVLRSHDVFAFGTDEDYPDPQGLSWGALQQTSAPPDFSRLEQWMDTCEADNLEMMYTISLLGLGEWAGGLNPSLSAYEDFVGPLSEVIGGRVSRFENVNEHNQLPWYTGDSGTHLPEMARISAEYFRPYGTILLAPSTVGELTYIKARQFYAGGGGQYVDAGNLHDYFSRNADDLPLVYGAYWQMLADFGEDEKDQYITEGATYPFGDTDANKAIHFTKAHLISLAMGFKTRIGYSYDSAGASAYDTLYDKFNGALTTAGVAANEVIDWTVGAELVDTIQSLDSVGPIRYIDFTRSGGYSARAIWSASGAPSYSVPALYTQHRDIAGGLTTGVSGSISLSVSPILLENQSP